MSVTVGATALLATVVGCAFEGPASNYADVEPVDVDRGLVMLDNGLTANGFATSGGLTVNGASLSLFTYEDYGTLGFANVSTDGVQLNGFDYDSSWLSGQFLESLQINTSTQEGVQLNGLRYEGFRLVDTSLSFVSTDGVQLNGAPLTSDQEDAVVRAVKYVAECALSSTQSATVTKRDGTQITYQGQEGLAPEWHNGILGVGKSVLVATCVIERANAAQDNLVVDSHWAEDTVRKILKYVARCALPSHAAIQLDDGSTFPGSVGLAPDWTHRGMTDLEKRRVSACLAALANSKGVSVPVYLRNPDWLPASGNKISDYPLLEGAFRANFFTENPYVETCSGSTRKPYIGRDCANGGCGFAYAGSCFDAASGAQALEEIAPDLVAGASVDDLIYLGDYLESHGRNWDGPVSLDGDSDVVNVFTGYTAELSHWSWLSGWW